MIENFSGRGTIIKLIFGVTFLVVIIQLINLQLINKNYGPDSFSQSTYRKTIYPSRGLIYDKNQKLILDNTTLYDLVVIPAQLKGVDTSIILKILNIDTAEFKKRVVTAIVKNGRHRASVFEGLLDEKNYARLNEFLYKIQPGFDLIKRPVRKYPYHGAAHLLGYLGEVDTAFLRKNATEGYQQGDYAGMTGLERSYEKVLLGQRGIEYWQRDNKNRPTIRYQQGEFDTLPISGSNLYSTLDIDLQMLGEKLLKGKIGSVVAIDPRTGGVLAMVSGPSYDPALLTGAERRKHFSELFIDPKLPLYNRAITGTYSPGSTFKTLQALVALQEGVITPAYGYPCPGRYNGCGNGKPKCHGAGHAPDLRHAIATSCNPYFADVYRKILDQSKYGRVDSGLSVWDRYMYAFGFGHNLGIDLPGEKRGNIPVPNDYIKKFGVNWNSCNIISNSIGQGEVNSTVLQLANAISMMANKGWYYTPHLIDSIEGGDKFGLLEPYKKKIQAINIQDIYFEAVHQGMEDVMISGTGRSFKIDGLTMCGKTGTVQNSYKGKPQKDHSFFAAFAPRENPRIAIACMVENGGWGTTIAAPVVSLMVEKYINDTISKKREPWIERYSNMSIIPARIQDEIKKRDSLNRVKDSIRLRKQMIKEIKDSTGITDDPDQADDSKPERKQNDKSKGDKKLFNLGYIVIKQNEEEQYSNPQLKVRTKDSDRV